MFTKTVLLLLVVISLFGCAHKPLITGSLIDSQVMSEKNKTLEIDFEASWKKWTPKLSKIT
ncbi:MAG TPA: hypothetical protein DD713_00460 [Nitrospiraceae bacterium]|nr:hypothetical protein [Nitrospiraceae bacterium]